MTATNSLRRLQSSEADVMEMLFYFFFTVICILGLVKCCYPRRADRRRDIPTPVVEATPVVIFLPTMPMAEAKVQPEFSSGHSVC